MPLRIWAGLALLAMVCLGCTGNGGRASGSWWPPAGLLAQARSPAAQAVPAPESAAKATVVVTIRWPDRDFPGFKAALIPLTTNSLVIRAKTGATVLAETVVVRQPGQATASAALDMDAASNVSIEAKAYRDAAPAADSTVIAVGVVAGLNLKPSMAIDVLVKLVPVFVPAVTSLLTNVGAAGDTIPVSGRNFGEKGAPISATIGGVAASVVIVSSTSIDVTIPQGATSGPIRVVADGVAAEPSATFWVVKSVAIQSPKTEWDHTNADTRLVLISATHSFNAAPTFAFEAGQSTASLGTPPAASWSVEPAAGVMNAAGEFKARSTVQTGTVKAQMGGAGAGCACSGAVATLSVSVQDVSVAVTASFNRVGALGQATVSLKPVHTFSDGATTSFFDFSSADASKVKVLATGEVVAADAQNNGAVEVKATSRIAPAKAAALTIYLRNAFKTVTTLAGAGTYLDGPASEALFGSLTGIGRDQAGNIYVLDAANPSIRKIASDGTVSTFAGNVSAPGFQDGASSVARFCGQGGLFVDATQHPPTLYVADGCNNRIRKIVPDGTVSTLAGSGQAGSDDGTGILATFQAPLGIARNLVDSALYVSQSNSIRKIASDGTVTTLAGSPAAGFADGSGTSARFDGPRQIAVDDSGVVFVADCNNHRIRKVQPNGDVSTLAGSSAGFADGTAPEARFNCPSGVALDGQGNLLVADRINYRIRKIVLSSSAVSTLAGGLSGRSGFADGQGPSAQFDEPSALTVGGGYVFVSEQAGKRVRKIDASGNVTSVAGSPVRDGTGSGAHFLLPIGIAVDPRSGSLLVADHYGHSIRKMAPDGQVITLAGTAAGGFADGKGNQARFFKPFSLAFARNGDAYLTEASDGIVRKLSPDGTVTRIAGSTGNIGYVDGTGETAQFRYPRGIAVDAADNLYVADYGNHVIRKIDSNRVVSTLAGDGMAGNTDGTGAAARFNYPEGLALDDSGNLFVADRLNHLIRKVELATRKVTTLAGGASGFTDGSGDAARFHQPVSLAFDGAGSLYVSDWGNTSIRRVTLTGAVTTVAGGGALGFVDGSLAQARFYYPTGVAIDAQGRLIIADTDNQRIRMID
jgi:sugar lactone lactonase YvrE